MKKEDKKKKYVRPEKLQEAIKSAGLDNEVSKEDKKLQAKKAALKKMRSQSYGN